jgi:hypothetical protein
VDTTARRWRATNPVAVFRCRPLLLPTEDSFGEKRRDRYMLAMHRLFVGRSAGVRMHSHEVATVVHVVMFPDIGVLAERPAHDRVAIRPKIET